MNNNIQFGTISDSPVQFSLQKSITTEDYGVSQKQQRGHEDRYKISTFENFRYYAVFDGHGGSKMMGPNHVADYAVNHLDDIIYDKLQNIDLNNVNAVAQVLSQSFIDLDIEMYNKRLEYGCTCTSVLIDDKRNLIYQVNLGDSRSILINKGSIVATTNDHKPTNSIEQSRIKSAGSYVTSGRINSSLAVARALGDFDLPNIRPYYYKSIRQINKNIILFDPINGPVSAVPDVQVTPKNQVTNIILTSDAPFENDAFDNESLVVLSGQAHSFNPEMIAQFMVEKIAPRTTDDTTIIYVNV